MTDTWTRVPLSDLAEVSTGKGIRREARLEDGPVPIFGANGVIGYTVEPLLVEPAVIVGRVGAYGAVNIAAEGSWVSDNALICSPKPNVPYKFLQALLETVDYDALVHGTTQPLITQSGLRAYEVMFPPIEDQRRIAEVLGALDDEIEACTRIAGTCDDLMSARWAVEFDDTQERPTGTLRDFCTSQYGVNTSGETEPVGPRLLRVTDINKSNWVDWRAVPYCRVSPDELAKYSLNVGDVVVARMADPGKSAIIEVQEPAVFASYLIRIAPKAPNANYFLFGFLKSRFFTDYAEGASSGSVQQNMNAQTILNAPCSVPSPEALQNFQSWAHEVRQGVVAAIKERAALLDLRDFLLPRLVSGELRVAAAEELVEAAT